MRRRDFINLLGGTAAGWPAPTAQAQPAKVPVIGYLDPNLEGRRSWLVAFQKGLSAAGFVEGRNLTVEYRSAEGETERLPELAADLVRKGVAVIVAASPPAALAAKRATQTIPVVFASGADPVRVGLVSSINRPGGNLTGFYFLLSEVVGKRLSLLRELAPRIRRVAVLVNPANAADAEPTARNAAAAAGTLGLEIRVFDGYRDASFADLVRWQADTLFVGPDPLFRGLLQQQVVALAARHSLASSGFNRDFVDLGGLMSYGPDIADSYRQAGGYVGRILKGEKPGDLPVVQPTKYEMVINLRTAKTLGLDVPPTVLAIADDVVE